MHHESGPYCPLCEEKLKTAHPYLVEWFHKVKERHNSVHVACAWRGSDEQLEAFNQGRSRCTFPNSKHNFQIDGKPCSLALDIFQIDADGVARWSWKFFELVSNESAEEKLKILWGGTFHPLRDGPHFQYTGSM